MSEKKIAPRAAFEMQKRNAQSRGIGWELTFEQWWEIWEPVYHLRGRGKNGLCMGRERDEGPYAVGNVYITTNLGNMMDYHRRGKRVDKKRQEAIERGGAPVNGYGWAHPKGRTKGIETRSEAMKQKRKGDHYIACVLDGDDVLCASESP
ncbi:hypothetical protein [Cupriavidus gilardii]|uniref:Uncharacterized protein n=1 Tax=Cupriavidus gilardii TaxID=82541 RepID=A0A849B8L8_9BURK|nr:hypothetical protein [Cupriavidus gilardii]KAB0597779.1 hypothetical protein F7Q96_07615 [Cupriavidus gilardii]NNH12070.1 hypothetical protein [Cupriavidus gilardii]WNG69297.1 hypothetical protein QWJ31_19550 [Cupriavidus gilardii]